MDPQSVAFHPQGDIWKLQTELQRVQALQAEHNDRILRIERKQDEDARMKSVWGGASPFPGVLSGTPSQTPLHRPAPDSFKDFDDEANLIGSLQLDAEEEPRRLGSTSRANSVRFDESANHGHWSHASRSSMDLIRSAGGVPMGERSLSHKSEGRASSVHSMRSAASGRASSLNIDTGYSFGDSSRSPAEDPGLAPGLLVLGTVPAIVRCWLNTNFKHNALMHAAVCTGSYKSFLDRRLIDKLGFSNRISQSLDGTSTVTLQVFLPEAVPHPASVRSGSPQPQVPTMTVQFTVFNPPSSESDDSRGIQIIIGSDALRLYSADILFSSNRMSLFDDERNKLSIPLVRPEDDRTFKGLCTASSQVTESRLGDVSPHHDLLNGLGQRSQISAESDSSAAGGIIGSQRSTAAASLDLGNALDSSDDEKAPRTGRSIRFASATETLAAPEYDNITPPETEEPEPRRNMSHTTPPPPAIWSNWRQRGPEQPPAPVLDYASASKQREPVQRKESGMKVLRPMKSGSRSFSATSTSSSGVGGDGRSRFFDDGRKRGQVEGQTIEQKRTVTPPPDAASQAQGSPAQEQGAAPDSQTPKQKIECQARTNSITSPHSLTHPLIHRPYWSAVSYQTSDGLFASSGVGLRPISNLLGLPPLGSSPAGTTASLLKKRKIIAGKLVDDGNQTSDNNPLFAPEVDHPDRQPSPARSSSPVTAASRGNTPLSPLRPASARFLEGLEQAADSPSDAYAAMTLDPTGQVAEEGLGRDQNETAVRSMAVINEKTASRRSASPAKRSASKMGGRENSAKHSSERAGSLDDVTMADGSESREHGHSSDGNDLETLDERVDRVMALQSTSIAANEAGYLVSYSWLSKVFSKSSKMRSLRDWDEVSINTPVGLVDNADVVPSNAFTGPHLKFDGTGADFIPLRPQLERGVHFEVLPKAAWDLIVEWYGAKDGQLPIIRYAKDTAPPGSTQQNISYEYYPPVFTIRKMLSGNSRSKNPLTPPRTNSPSTANTRQGTPEQDESLTAVRLVASRQDRFNSFLARSKRAAGIPLEHKVRPWRQSEPASPPNGQTAIPTPATSREITPADETALAVSLPKLVLEKAEFAKLQDGTSLEMIDAKDNTGNPNYNGSSTLDMIGLIDDQIIILEEQLRGPAGGEFASDAKKAKQKNDDSKTGSTIPISAGAVTRGRVRRDGRARGTIGLTNLGNTCYMNSALQCISRIEELAFYFLENQYKEEINHDNPLGYNGRMAKSYGDFLHHLYLPGSNSAYTPRPFKGALSQAQPMFSGYGQQDSQEFLSFLVDALHEDLNRIHKKPYLENPDSDDARVHDPEYIKELGNIYRDNHRKRNDSIAMDLFNGFYKNTMVCPTCDKISVTFDPYSLLTLQLPVENTWQHKLFYIPDRGKPTYRAVDLDKSSSIKTLKQHLAKEIGGTNPQHLMVVEMFQMRVYKVYKDGESVAEITNQDQILVFELPQQPTNIGKAQKSSIYRSMLSQHDDEDLDMESPAAESMAVTVNLRTTKGSSWQHEYQPMVIMITREEAKDYDAILGKIFAGVAKYTSRGLLDENDTALTSASEAHQNSDSDLTTSSESVVHVNGKLSDRSVPSDDDYVNVTMTDGPDDSSQTLQFPESSISPALRRLFQVKYFKSSSGDYHCAGMNPHYDAAIMSERVQQPFSRRSSVASLNSVQSRSTEASGNSHASSSTEGDETPDMLPHSMDRRSPTDGVVSDEEELPTLMEPSPILETRGPGRRKGPNSRRRRNQVTYGRRNRYPKQTVKKQPRSDFVRSSSQTLNAIDDPYYIKLGEGICLDWTDEGWDAFFGGDPRTPEDDRGYMTINENFMTPVKDEVLEQKIQRRARRRKEGVTLDDCFAETARTETLSEENAWYCNRCKELRRADKTLMIWTAPDVLVLHLKRFSGERYRRDKVDVLVDFPLEGLDLSERIGCKEDGKDYIYDLFAVDNHYGGLGGGHYTAFAKNFFNDKWYDFNDSFVSEQSKGVVTPSAYLLFYRRRSSTPLGPPYLQELVEEARNPPDSDDEPTKSQEGHRLGDTTGQASSNGAVKTETGLLLPRRTSDEGVNGVHDGGWSFDTLGSGDKDTDSTKGDVDDAEERWFDDEGIVESTEDDGLP